MHDVNLAAEFANQVMVMKAGRVVAAGEPPEVLTEDLLRTVFGLQVIVDAHPVSGAPRITPIHTQG
jgi:iron complex transport system ATP-binding protein